MAPLAGWANGIRNVLDTSRSRSARETCCKRDLPRIVTVTGDHVDRQAAVFVHVAAKCPGYPARGGTLRAPGDGPSSSPGKPGGGTWSISPRGRSSGDRGRLGRGSASRGRRARSCADRSHSASAADERQDHQNQDQCQEHPVGHQDLRRAREGRSRRVCGGIPLGGPPPPIPGPRPDRTPAGPAPRRLTCCNT